MLYSGEDSISQITYPCVVKAQLLCGKRGKSGGVRVVHDEGELRTAIGEMRELRFDGKTPDAILMTPWLDIEREHYLGLTIDGSMRAVALIYSPDGGVDIEETAQSAPGRVLRIILRTAEIDETFLAGLSDLGIGYDAAGQICDIARKLLRMFMELDLTTVEINPLAQLKNGTFNAADAKVVMDDNAIPRQGDYTILPREKHVSARERFAAEAMLAYVELDEEGSIGVIAGGAGIGMATVDSVKFLGGRPFNFLDLGGGVTKEKAYAATSLLLHIRQVKGIIINAFGGANDLAVLAEGVCMALDEGSDKTVVVKSRGFNQKIGWRMYDERGILQVRYGTTDEAVAKLLGQIEGGGR